MLSGFGPRLVRVLIATPLSACAHPAHDVDQSGPNRLGRVKRCRRKFSHEMAAMGKPPAETAVAAECRRFHPDVTNVPRPVVVNQEFIEHPTSLRRESRFARLDEPPLNVD